MKNGVGVRALGQYIFTLCFTEHYSQGFAPVRDAFSYSHFAEEKAEVHRGKRKYYSLFIRRNGIRDLMRNPKGHNNSDQKSKDESHHLTDTYFLA